MANLTYNPAVFEQPDLEAAKQIILTPTSRLDTETRWQRETPYLAGLIAELLGIRSEMLVVDYGCGVGRVSKALIELTGCRVLGVDISQKMRSLAPEYVASNAFSVVSRAVLQAMASTGLRADAAFSAWVFQHCVRPNEDIGLLASALRPNAPVAVINSKYRLVPTVEQQWAGDRVDVGDILTASFGEAVEVAIDAAAVGERIKADSWFRTYRT